mmetsp:Transcript_88172/g.284762  ORF Transcript_88172/g.284762 Transcript_88172/m.284762 type:complete len:248 (-) Transcript_88172:187-930(-)
MNALPDKLCNDCFSHLGEIKAFGNHNRLDTERAAAANSASTAAASATSSLYLARSLLCGAEPGEVGRGGKGPLVLLELLTLLGGRRRHGGVRAHHINVRARRRAAAACAILAGLAQVCGDRWPGHRARLRAEASRLLWCSALLRPLFQLLDRHLVDAVLLQAQCEHILDQLRPAHALDLVSSSRREAAAAARQLVVLRTLLKNLLLFLLQPCKGPTAERHRNTRAAIAPALLLRRRRRGHLMRRHSV